MKVIDGAGRWGERINFVDDNNVFVGFDNDANCCEVFGYYLTRTKPTGRKPDDTLKELDFPGFNFDTEFATEEDLVPSDNAGGSITFRLTNGEEELFLTLYNYHNGCYSHGWSTGVNDHGLCRGAL